MIVRNNTMSLRAYNANRKTVGSIKKNLEKLSSGYRINRAADDAAGLGVSERLQAKITELDRSEDNALEGIDLARTADAALQEVNDMLKRARSLCIQAENGTYSDQELSAISDEMNHLFSEIDRISAGSYHNSICLFRQDVGQTYHDEYDERFNALKPEDLQLWGELDYIESGDFEEAEDAIPATATFTLGDSIQFDDPDTLEGKSIQIGSETYYFSKGSLPINFPDYTHAHRVAIGTGANAVEDALKSLKTYSSDVADVTVDKDARTVTLTAPLEDLWDTIQADGGDSTSVVPDGNGEDANGTPVQGPNSPISQVDGSGSQNNKPVYSSTAQVKYSLNNITGALTQDQVDNLKKNTLRIYGSGVTKIIKFADTSGTDTVGINVGMTKQQLGNAIANCIKAANHFSATFNNTSGNLEIDYDNMSTTSSQYMYIYEYRDYETSGSSGPDSANAWTSTGTAFDVKVTQPATQEGAEICTFTIPSNLDLSKPFSFQLGGTNYLYYDSSQYPTTSPGYPSTDWTGASVSYSDRCNTSGMSEEQIRNHIFNRIKAYVSGKNPGAEFTSSGNALTINSKRNGFSLNLAGAIKAVTVTATPYKYPGSTPKSDYVLSSNGVSVNFKQDVVIPFSLGSTLDKAKLAGSGFSIGSRNFEFVNGAGSGIRSNYIDIDISGCADFSNLSATVETALHRAGLSSYGVRIDSNGKMEIAYNRSTSSSEISIMDGNDGITDGAPIQFEGGVNTGFSQKAIDFSSINEDNLDTLLGKGFRINCATCTGEYINVFFCWTNDGSVPLTFDRLVDDGAGNKVTRTIHNIPVELSKVSSGDKIVQSIVDQVSPQLTHFTGVAVGDPPTTLITYDRRVGGAADMHSGQFLPASVETGVETNFTYSVSHKLVPDLPEGDLEELKTAAVNIYVGSDPEAQIIPIHLPYIDLYHLRLCPPAKVDLTSEDQSASDWLGRVDRADVAISSARGTIGADYNRLEHAVQDLSNAHIQLSDAYSVIRDTDMAGMMMKQIKDQILVQAQQSMLAQANQVPQGVLQLVQ